MMVAWLHSHRVSPNLQFVDLVTAEATHEVAHAGIVGSARANFSSPTISREGPGVMTAAAAALERWAIGVGRASACRGLMCRAEEVDAKRREETSSASEVGRFCILTMFDQIQPVDATLWTPLFSHGEQHNEKKTKPSGGCAGGRKYFSSSIPAVL